MGSLKKSLTWSLGIMSDQEIARDLPPVHESGSEPLVRKYESQVLIEPDNDRLPKLVLTESYQKASVAEGKKKKRARFDQNDKRATKAHSKVTMPDGVGGSFAEFMHQSIRASEVNMRNTDSIVNRESESIRLDRLPTITDGEVLDLGRSSTVDASMLTEQQIVAFREVFELFDKNGGGTIDASELQKTLADVGIEIDGADLHEVMLTLDGDGNGEVDFDEFLKLMTDTEMFIEALADKNTRNTKTTHPVSNRVLLFDALTQFMKKQALNNASEIVGYYAKKYRKDAKKFMYAMTSKGAHVVQHYADGARLIGLTDAQLFKQLKLLQSHQNDQNLDDKEAQSPYAKSFHVGLLRSLMRDRARKCPIKPFQLGGPKPRIRKHLRNIPVHKISQISNRIKIRVVGIEGPRQAPFRSPVLGPSQSIRERRKSIAVTVHQQEANRPIQHLPGWMTHRTRVTDVDIVIQPGWSKVPINRITELKEVVHDARDAYLTRVACEKMGTNLKLYRSLNTIKAPTIGLQAQLKRCMVAYSSGTNDDLVGKISPKLLDHVFKKDKVLKPIRPKLSAYGLSNLNHHQMMRC